ncbi:hypothetical protein JH06_0290 [Blastocystis sp. subtype 4]|uniref:hypothetical protein n=1 Tax=Blastocystis sp. subtype 4 TaxID=944170 RepID=UPI000711D6D9|nr:hypothetical protein JH06_0290 [Blastocystis sp. subtype 4]KNB46110.1 hypothetical protein JH06_0290 [Blastocystis sp. subtype 4]|eukprot:XP_014529553.1 hypothetical protein JH06_0290 [Blastocystis sp. subtype 4]
MGEAGLTGFDYLLLQEEHNVEYEPTEEEIREEARFLGIDDEDYLWIAKEALRAPLPRHWRPYQNRKSGAIVYYNDKTGEVSENHPMDEYFRSLYQKLRTDPMARRSRSDCRQFIPLSELSQSPFPKAQTDLNSELYLTSLRSYKSHVSQQLCKETHQLALDDGQYRIHEKQYKTD